MIIWITHIFFLTPFLPPFESPLFLPTAMTEARKRKGSQISARGAARPEDGRCLDGALVYVDCASYRSWNACSRGKFKICNCARGLLGYGCEAVLRFSRGDSWRKTKDRYCNMIAKILIGILTCRIGRLKWLLVACNSDFNQLSRCFSRWNQTNGSI